MGQTFILRQAQDERICGKPFALGTVRTRVPAGVEPFDELRRALSKYGR